MADPWGVMYLQEERVLPSQYFTAADTPERSLLAAVLQQAVEDLQNPRLMSCGHRRGDIPRAAAKLRRETRAWFASEDEEHIFSFLSICHVLGLDPGAIRSALKVW